MTYKKNNQITNSASRIIQELNLINRLFASNGGFNNTNINIITVTIKKIEQEYRNLETEYNSLDVMEQLYLDLQWEDGQSYCYDTWCLFVSDVLRQINQAVNQYLMNAKRL